MSASRVVVFGALLAGAAGAVSVTEAEPDGFTTPAPQAVGVVGSAGITITGTLDPTSPTGLAPGDSDGFSFTMESDGPFRAVVDDGAGGTFLVALVEQAESGLVLRSAVLGPCPLSLSRPLLAAGTVFRVGVAAFGDGTPRPYTLVLDPVDAVAPWTGESCAGVTPEAEPNEDAFEATYLGWFDRTLCASGDIAVVSPIDSGIEGDTDQFRFRNVLPVPVTLSITADPGQVDVVVERLVYVGSAPIASASFGSETTLGLPALEPGSDYLVRVSARQGTAPLHYDFHLEPVAQDPEPPPEPLDLAMAVLRIHPDAARSRFTFRGVAEPGFGVGLDEDTSLVLKVRGGETALASGSMTLDGDGRLLWKAPKGVTGIRTFSFDPFTGILKVKGKGVDLAGDVDPADPEIYIEADFGTERIAATATGTFSRNRRVLRVK